MQQADKGGRKGHKGGRKGHKGRWRVPAGGRGRRAGKGAVDPQLVQVVNDSRLSSDARVAVLHVAGRGEGWHEISAEEWSMLLAQAGDHRVRRALRQAVFVGWLARESGGRGHSDRFRFRPANPARVSVRPPKSATLSTDRIPESTTLNGIGSRNPPPYEGGRGEQEREEEERESEREARARELAPAALKVLEGYDEKLAGCRGALQDYLASHVPRPKQCAYVHTVATWLDDPAGIFRREDGTTVADRVEQTAILAAALNELAATDEPRMKWPEGDVRNLRTKIEILTRKRYDDHYRRSSRTSDPGRPAPDGDPDALRQAGAARGFAYE